MTVLSLRLPESLHRKLADLAESEGVSINQLINSAVAEKMAALLTEEYLEERAKRATRKRFAKALAKVADIEPEDVDRRDRRGRVAFRPSTARLILAGSGGEVGAS